MKMLKEIIELLYHISIGAWITSLSITIFYDNSIPMWILLVVMNVFNFISIGMKDFYMEDFNMDMTVRAVITMNRGVKYRIDGIFYESSMYIPEIIRDRVVDMYGLLDGIMIIRTKQHIKE